MSNVVLAIIITIIMVLGCLLWAFGTFITFEASTATGVTLAIIGGTFYWMMFLAMYRLYDCPDKSKESSDVPREVPSS
jgi:hypothetical protein